MDQGNNNTVMQVQIRKMVEDRFASIRNRDIETAMSFYAADVVSFDVVGALEFKSKAAVKQRLEQWFSGFKAGAIGFDWSDLSITSSEDIAFCHNLNHVHAHTSDGNLLDMWWRETTCYKKTEGKWLIIHAHNSVPFDMKSGKPSLNLKP